MLKNLFYKFGYFKFYYILNRYYENISSKKFDNNKKY